VKTDYKSPQLLAGNILPVLFTDYSQNYVQGSIDTPLNVP